MTTQRAHRLTGQSWNATGDEFAVTVTHAPWADMRTGTPAAMTSRALHREERRTGQRAIARRVSYATLPDGAGTVTAFTFRFHPAHTSGVTK